MSSSKVCTVGASINYNNNKSNNSHPALKPVMMARNASLGENVPPNGGEGNNKQASHLAPPPVTPDSPRPQKGDQSPLAAVSCSLAVPLPTGTQKGK